MEATKERLKLRVISVGAVEKVGQKQIEKLTFTAHADGADAKGAVRYFTFAKSVFPFIIKEAEIDVEVETSERENQGNLYVDRKVVQLYQGGKEVVQPRDGGRGNWKGEYKKDSASIESQVAAKCVADLWAADRLKDTDPLVKDFKNWCSAKLKASIARVTEPPVQIAEPEHSKPASAPAESPAPKQAKKMSQLEVEFARACKEAGYDLKKPEDIDAVKAWMNKHFKTFVPFNELIESVQKDMVEAMKKEALPFS